MPQIYSIISILYNIYFYMIIFYVLMSWLPNVRDNFIGELLGKLVEPYLRPFRRIIPPLFGTIDFSPIVALFVLELAMRGLVAVLNYFIA
ncbi:YggT family protein [Paenibacillus sp. HN-1]|uniref:YggT family protein n=1 Tax=Paenibacillus TaxID=44249 RepID=UPI001CA7F4AD|nr:MULTISPECIES: YggT family protein [Paenibacillus]MBY9076979.1 YggT family protein [Paenibacillus sp. CGMCC 1.18879]MBY9086244.1 YggT family protein [Paenibacillus sinensis]